MEGPILFPNDRTHGKYDPDWAGQFMNILKNVYEVLQKYRAVYRGRTTPINFWWGTFDLSVSRFSGIPASPPENAGLILRGAMDTEFVECGFWPGDERFSEPAFYSFTYPQPKEIEKEKITPEEAYWNEKIREFILPYEFVRNSKDPKDEIIEFFDSTFCAGAKSANWNLKNLM